MNKKIICNINMGSLLQDIVIQQGNNIIGKYKLSMQEIPNFIYEHKDISQIYIHGNKAFSQKIEQKFNTIMFSKRKEKNLKNFYYI